MPAPTERGDPAPWFETAALQGRPDYAFQTTAGRHIVLLFTADASAAECAQAVARLGAIRALLDDAACSFFGIVSRAELVAKAGLAPSLPGIRYLLDYDGRVHGLYAAARPCWLLLDPMHRLLLRCPLERWAELTAHVERIADEGLSGGQTAPVLVLPRVFDPGFCRELVAFYRARGGQDSGFMREESGRTVRVIDYGHKRRSDTLIDDPKLRYRAKAAIERRLLPEVRKAFQFAATRIERYIVACYSAADSGHFRPHRDNTTKGTAHRKFAVTINLNAEDFEGGELRFPEFGRRTYRADTGGAVVFSCSLLHEATPVTRGERFAFLPFLYDEAGAVIRERNNRYLADDALRYRLAEADQPPAPSLEMSN